MKFMRFLVNFVFFIVVTFSCSLLQIGVYDMNAIQSDTTAAIALWKSDDDSDSVLYWDAYSFWATDIQTNLEQEAKYRVRNWMPYSWWKDGTEWADVAIDSLVSIVKPVFVPNAQISALNDYYGESVSLISIYDSIYDGLSAEDKIDLQKSIYEYYAFIDASEVLTNSDVNSFMTSMDTLQWDGYEADEDGNINDSTFADITSFNTITGKVATSADAKDMLLGEGYKSTYAVLNRLEDGSSISHDDDAYGCWVKNNYTVYNYEWKITKYNNAAYDHYYTSFIENDSIKTPVVVLYSQFTVSLILAFYFVFKYPINMFQARLSVKKDKHGKNTLD